MQLGMVGLGRMGAAMVRRLMADGHECVVYDRSPEPAIALAAEGATATTTLDEFVAALRPPRHAWVMVPSGSATEQTVTALGELVEAGDVIIDGGNSFYKDDVRRAAALAERSIRYVDVGTSGGVWGERRGYCLMIGGPAAAVRELDPVFKSLAPGRGSIERTPGRDQKTSSSEDGYLHCGPVGAGHFVKMIHNGIEYGIMQAYAEGFDLLQSARSSDVPPELRYPLDLPEIAEVWRRGSVVGSWLLDLTATALLEDPGLTQYSGHVSDSGEGRWTVQTALERAVPADVLTAALYTRFRSRQDHTFAEKILSAMRKQFGGHREPQPTP